MAGDISVELTYKKSYSNYLIASDVDAYNVPNGDYVYGESIPGVS